MKEIRKAQSGTPRPAVAQFLQSRKPLEELYDVTSDPHELHNLADDPQHAARLTELRQQHLQWVLQTRDLGLIPEAELHRLRTDAGSEWAILNQGKNAERRMEKIRDVAHLAGETDAQSLAALTSLLSHSDATVRYWAATGIGNRFVDEQWAAGSEAKSLQAFVPALQDAETSPLLPLLNDDSANTQVAAARAIMLVANRQAMKQRALAAISAVLDDGTQWARVHAAIVLDELEDAAFPALQAMKRNKAYRDGFVAKGKYTVRVLNKALNDLEGTHNTVP